MKSAALDGSPSFPGTYSAKCRVCAAGCWGECQRIGHLDTQPLTILWISDVPQRQSNCQIPPTEYLTPLAARPFPHHIEQKAPSMDVKCHQSLPCKVPTPSIWDVNLTKVVKFGSEGCFVGRWQKFWQHLERVLQKTGNWVLSFLTKSVVPKLFQALTSPCHDLQPHHIMGSTS